MATPKTTGRSTFQGVDTQQDFSLVSSFLGYRNKEDITNLPAGYLVKGSQNVLTTTSSRIGIRGGYTLDGQADSSGNPILSSTEWLRTQGDYRYLRVANKVLQYRYGTGSSAVWIDLFTAASSYVNFDSFWDANTEKTSLLLFVDGSSNIYMWSGGVTTFSSATTNTITKEGTTTWAEEGFLLNGTRKVTINGIDYTYTGGETTTTLTGVTPDPTAVTITAGDVIQQTVVTTPNTSMSGIDDTFPNDGISILDNQVYIGSKTKENIFVSKINSYTDFTYTTPVRAPGEGAEVNLKGAWRAFVPQEDVMYISSGDDLWYQTKLTLSSDLTKEDFSIKPLKTSAKQSAKSQGLVSKIKNSVMFVNKEPTLDELGRMVQSETTSTLGSQGISIQNNTATPTATNISDPIKLDFDAYDFTDGHLFYYKNFIYLSAPKEGLVRIFNIAKGYWEAPQLLPIGRFAIIEGNLYGHSYLTTETYKLFDGYNDNGQPIDAKAVFSYQNFGKRALSKYFNEFYSEGYISTNTILNLGIKYEIDGNAQDTEFKIDGSNSQYVAIQSNLNSLGKFPLGKSPLGGSLPLISTSLPPKFRVIHTMPRNDFYEVQVSYYTSQVDAQWEILAFGPLVTLTMYGNNALKAI